MPESPGAASLTDLTPTYLGRSTRSVGSPPTLTSKVLPDRRGSLTAPSPARLAHGNARQQRWWRLLCAPLLCPCRLCHGLRLRLRRAVGASRSRVSPTPGSESREQQQERPRGDCTCCGFALLATAVWLTSIAVGYRYLHRVPEWRAAAAASAHAATKYAGGAALMSQRSASEAFSSSSSSFNSTGPQRPLGVHYDANALQDDAAAARDGYQRLLPGEREAASASHTASHPNATAPSKARAQTSTQTADAPAARKGEACEPANKFDMTTRSCEGACEERFAKFHCRMCKCVECGYCGPSTKSAAVAAKERGTTQGAEEQAEPAAAGGQGVGKRAVKGRGRGKGRGKGQRRGRGKVSRKRGGKGKGDGEASVQ